jgi:O-antigen ligase
MPRPDPWEKREAERAKIRQGNEPRDLFEELQRHRRAISLLILLTILLFAEVPGHPKGWNLWLTILGSSGLLVLGALCRDYTEPLKSLWHRGPNPFLIALVVWCGIEFALTPLRSSATGEMFRILAGAGGFFFAAYALRNAREVSATLVGILILSVSVALYDLAHFAQKNSVAGIMFNAKDTSVFGTHESIGSALALLLPIALVFGLAPGIEEKRRLAAQAATLILGFAWAIARCRSAWIGGAVALIFAGILLVRYGGLAANPKKTKQKKSSPAAALSRLVASPVLMLVGAFVVVALLGGAVPLLSRRLDRFSNVLEDVSFETRLVMWNGGLRMLSERPWLGWGLDGYLRLQGNWTHLGQPPEVVLQSGADHYNIAHNYYVQWAADTGVIGLALFIGMVVGFLIAGLRALPRVSGAFERAVLIASLSSAVAGAVEIVGSPAFQFAGVYTLYFLILGLGMAAMRGAHPQEVRRFSGSFWIALLIGAGISVGFLILGRRLSAPTKTPPGTFQLIELDRGRSGYHPGDTIRWRTIFRDGFGRLASTYPGTLWRPPVVLAKNGTVLGGLENADSTLEGKEVRIDTAMIVQMEYSVQVPRNAEEGVLFFEATYFDVFGRRYVASRGVDITPGK